MEAMQSFNDSKQLAMFIQRLTFVLTEIVQPLNTKKKKAERYHFMLVRTIGLMHTNDLAFWEVSNQWEMGDLVFHKYTYEGQRSISPLLYEGAALVLKYTSWDKFCYFVVSRCERQRREES